MKSFRKNKKGVSPVIATIIIVAIAIVLSIAVAYWILGLGASFTKYEKVEFVSAYASGPSGGVYTIAMTIKNTGTATATLDPATVFYNGKPATAYAADNIVCTFSQTTLNPGQNATGTITMNSGGSFVSGMSLEVMLQTASGSQYPKVITLP